MLCYNIGLYFNITMKAKPMIYSMTGYAAKPIQINSALIQIELKSVNHRFLDITFKSAEEFKPLETTLRNLLTKEITRGKIDIKCFFKDNKSLDQELHLNQPLLTQYISLIKQIDVLSNAPSPISATQILSMPGVIKQHELSLDDMQEDILTGFSQLITTFKVTQATEGEKIKEMLNSRLIQISLIIQQARPLLTQVTIDYREKLKLRLSEVLGEVEISDNRLQQEFAFFCQKIDISEEIDRLEAHVAEFNKLLNKGGAIGKRLDFICQEMHREANTFGSKSVSIDTTQKAVDLKVLIEQIREQIQNIM